MLPSPSGCRLGPRGLSLSRPQRVHFCYGPVTRDLPSGDLVDRLQSFSFHHLCYPNYRALTFTPAGLSPAEHANLPWTHHRTRSSRFIRLFSPRTAARCEITPVLPGIRLTVALPPDDPSLQPHYRAFPTTTSDSAPVLRLGTLAGTTCLTGSRHIGATGSHVPPGSQDHAPFMPDAGWAIIGHPPTLSQERSWFRRRQKMFRHVIR